MSENRLFELASSVADGTAIDWRRAEREAEDDASRERIRALRAVAEIGNVHRTLSEIPNDAPRTAASRHDANNSLGVSSDPDAPTADPPSMLPPLLHAEVPRRWGDLEICEALGCGAFGTVFRAYDDVLDRQIALKILSPEDSVRAKAAVHEGRLLARVKHPNVVAVYGAELRDREVGISMELIHGRTLASIVERQGAFGAREATIIGIDICRALAAVHGAGIAHGDVKAQNVMREDGGRIVLTDFGVGRDLGSLSDRDNTLSGTPLYLAPELFEGQSGGIRADLYSVGVLLFYLTSGEFPVHGRSLHALREAHRKGLYVLLRDRRPEIPSAFAACVEQALEANPKDRFQSAGSFVSSLERALQAQTTGAHSLDELDQSNGAEQHPRRRRRWAWAAGFTITLLASGMAAWRWLAPCYWPPLLEEPVEILILETEAPPEALSLAGRMAKTLEAHFNNTPDFLVTRNEDIQDALQRMQVRQTRSLAPVLAKRLCLREGIEFVLWVTLHLTNGEARVDLRLEECEGAEIASASPAIRSSGLRGRLERATNRLVRAARRAMPSSIRPLPAVTTRNDEALGLYSSALEAHEIGMLDSAIAKLQLATEIDPGFSTAWAQLGSYLHGAHRFNEALEAIERARSTSSGLTRSERFLVGATVLRYFRQDEEAERLLSTSLDYNSDGNIARLLSMTRYRLLHPPAVILEAAERAAELSPDNSVTQGWLVMMLAVTGKLDAAESKLAEARSRLGDFAYSHWCEGIIHMMRGDTRKATDSFEKLRGHGALFASYGNLMEARSQALEGALENAETTLRSGIQHDRDRGYVGNEMARYLYLADLMRVSNRPLEAEKWLAHIEALPANPAFILQMRRAGVLLASIGRPDRASAVLEKLEIIAKASPSRTCRSAVLLVRAAIATAHSDRSAATKFLQQSETERFDWESLRLRILLKQQAGGDPAADSDLLDASRGYVFLEDFPLDNLALSVKHP